MQSIVSRISKALGLPPSSLDLQPLIAKFAPAIDQSRRIFEFPQLFYSISSLNVRNEPYVLQFVGSVEAEGVSSIAAGFSKEAAAQLGGSVLFIDCTPVDPSRRHNWLSLVDAHAQGVELEAVIDDRDTTGVHYAYLSKDGLERLSISSLQLKALFERLKQKYSVVVLDCPPVLRAPISLALARQSDATLFVVRAETTSQTDVIDAKNLLQSSGGQLVGAVFNQERSYLPAWLSRYL